MTCIVDSLVPDAEPHNQASTRTAPQRLRTGGAPRGLSSRFLSISSVTLGPTLARGRLSPLQSWCQTPLGH